MTADQREILSADQQEAESRIEAFLNAGEEGGNSFMLGGLAGTGKTWLFSRIAKKRAGAIIVAPTAKAAQVLREKSGLETCTIHSLIYEFKGFENVEEGGHTRRNWKFRNLGRNLKGRTVFVDECSMVGAKVGKDLIATQARLAVCGDLGQLPPVNDKQCFPKANFTLKEIHRQALESPIIRQAHRVRQGLHYESDTEDFQVIDHVRGDNILEADMILCWTNYTRMSLNRRKRSLLGLPQRLQQGEPVMCLRNTRKQGVWNGAIYFLASERPTNGSLLLLDQDGSKITIPHATIEGDDDFDYYRDDTSRTPFAPAYASTVHKGQGSEWNKVLLVDEHPATPERTSWIYTGFTRACKSIKVRRNR